jgi:hypothetical protein
MNFLPGRRESQKPLVLRAWWQTGDCRNFVTKFNVQDVIGIMVSGTFALTLTGTARTLLGLTHEETLSYSHG